MSCATERLYGNIHTYFLARSATRIAFRLAIVFSLLGFLPDAPAPSFAPADIIATSAPFNSLLPFALSKTALLLIPTFASTIAPGIWPPVPTARLSPTTTTLLLGAAPTTTTLLLGSVSLASLFPGLNMSNGLPIVLLTASATSVPIPERLKPPNILVGSSISNTFISGLSLCRNLVKGRRICVP